MNNRSEPNPRLPMILWGALLASQFIYLGLLLAPEIFPARVEPADPSLAIIFIAIALTMASASFVLPRLLLRAALHHAEVALEEVPVHDAPADFRQQSATVRRFADPEVARAVALRAGLTPLIIGLALSESISLLGLVLGILGHPALIWAPFFACGMTLTAVRFPMENGLFRALSRAKGVSL
jgi:hypothetical protein